MKDYSSLADKIEKYVLIFGAVFVGFMLGERLYTDYKIKNPKPAVEQKITEEKPKIKLEEKKTLEDKTSEYKPISPINYSHLITDQEFIDSDYLNQEKIQKFLEQKGSVLAYKIEGKLFSEEIVKAAKKYQINPLLLLVRAQVEQGLVSAKQADEKKLSRIMGYGCLDNGKDLKSSLGFSNQIDNCARILRKNFDSFNPGKAIKVDNFASEIQPQNGATYSLFKYTPWTKKGGNALFRIIYDQYKSKLE